MLHILVLAVGKCRERHFAEACAEYAKRLTAFCRLSVAEVEEYRLSEDPTPAEIEKCIAREGRAILAKIPPRAAVIPLCVEGEPLTSPQLAGRISGLAAEGSCIAFVIGGSHGLSEAVKTAGRLRLSLSSMTLPHQLARVVLLEQVYRAFCILHGRKYHK